jgi:hypothetical protein
LKDDHTKSGVSAAYAARFNLAVSIAKADAGGRTMRSLDQEIETAILELLKLRGVGKSICPSEVARKVAPTDWEPLMETTRAVARRLVAAGEIVITQRGVVVDPAQVKGAIRFRRR